MKENLSKNILKNHSTKPNKTLGQNFLTDGSVLQKEIEAANLSKNDIVLEIGPGTGILTKELAKIVKKIMAIEKDPKMIEILKKEIGEYNNVEIIEGDILEITKDRLPDTNYKVVANIPYYLTSNLIRLFLEGNNQPEKIVLIIQKEVAERICSKPPKMNLLAVSVQFYAKPAIIGNVSRKSFWPEPNVDSAIIKIEPTKNNLQLINNKDLFFKIAKAGFSQPRKQLLNNFSISLKIDKEKTMEWLSKNKIDPIRRAETLEIKDWINLCNSF